MLIILPITSTDNGFPLHLLLEDGFETQGFVLCEHVKLMDTKVRKIKHIESTSEKFIDKIDQYINAIL